MFIKSLLRSENSALIIILNVLQVLCNNFSSFSGIVLNNSIFKKLSHSLIIGLEVLIYHDVMLKESSITFYPQILVHITRTFKVQLGIGLHFEANKFVPQFAYRVINESL